jgi:hypothetical protein
MSNCYSEYFIYFCTLLLAMTWHTKVFVLSLSLTRIDWNKKVTTSLCLTSHSLTLFLHSNKFSSSSQRDRHFYFISFSFLVPPIYRCVYICMFFSLSCITHETYSLNFSSLSHCVKHAVNDRSQSR